MLRQIKEEEIIKKLQRETEKEAERQNDIKMTNQYGRLLDELEAKRQEELKKISSHGDKQ